MGRITDWSYEHPDAILVGVGALGGTILGASANGLGGATLGASFGALVTLCAMHIDPEDPPLGPQQ